jgi:hypothetical protein
MYLHMLNETVMKYAGCIFSRIIIMDDYLRCYNCELIASVNEGIMRQRV